MPELICELLKVAVPQHFLTEKLQFCCLICQYCKVHHVELKSFGYSYEVFQFLLVGICKFYGSSPILSSSLNGKANTT
ncbi:MAG: hypothetical protein ACXW1A_06460 [Nitrososphaeraceae archaeon]